MKKIIIFILIISCSVQLNAFKGATWNGRGYKTTLKLNTDANNKTLGYITITNKLNFPIYITSLSSDNKPITSKWLASGESLNYIRFDWAGPYEIKCERSTNINNLKDTTNLQQISAEYALTIDNTISKIALFDPASGLCKSSKVGDYLGIGKNCRSALPTDFIA